MDLNIKILSILIIALLVYLIVKHLPKMDYDEERIIVIINKIELRHELRHDDDCKKHIESPHR